MEAIGEEIENPVESSYTKEHSPASTLHHICHKSSNGVRMNAVVV